MSEKSKKNEAIWIPVGDEDFAVFPSGSAYRIVWHVEKDPVKFQYVKATAEEKRALIHKGVFVK